jgi:UDP-2,3-diacylglucosamine hydrolase
MTTLLLSDLHLPLEPSPLRQGFAEFLEGPARTAQTVYILGDLFEYWIGDDAGLRDYAAEAAALRALSERGVHIGLMHGNRDFLIGRRFAAAAGVELLPDPLRLDLDGVPTLLSHGDVFCTDDIAYQRWRRITRKPLTQRLFYMMSESQRHRFSGSARRRSEAGQYDKPKAILDVNEHAVRAACARYGVARLIHGHTHRPAGHCMEVAGRACERIVLADWRPERMEYMISDAGGLRRQLL